MKQIITIFLIVCTWNWAHAQNVRFTNGALDNGLTYPIAEYSGHPEAQNKLNASILEIVSNYEDQEYCISQYGFVQHNKFLQLNFYFNCLDLDESERASYLFSLSDGEISPPSEMFSEDEERSVSYFRKKISEHYTVHGNTVPKEFIDQLSIDDCTVNLVEKGLEISIESRDDWPEQALLLTWSELSPYLKHLQSR